MGGSQRNHWTTGDNSQSGLEKGLLVQCTGKGALGSVKLNTQGVTARSTKAATAKMAKAAPAVRKPKATTAAQVSSEQTRTRCLQHVVLINTVISI